jgi:hypothetical protein
MHVLVLAGRPQGGLRGIGLVSSLTRAARATPGGQGDGQEWEIHGGAVGLL